MSQDLLEVVIDLSQVDCQNLLSTGLQQVVSTSCNKSENDKIVQHFVLFYLLQLDEIDMFIFQLIDKLQQAGKIEHNKIGHINQS